MNRRLLAAIALFLVLGAGALAWMLVPRSEPEREAPAPSPPSAEAPTQPSDERLAAARRAAFPDDRVVTEDGLSVTFPASRLIDAPFGPVLVSEGRVENAAHVTPGLIAVHYLRPDGDGFSVAQAFPAAVESGSNGRLSSWRVSDEFTELPVIHAEGGGTWQGHTCVIATLTELAPQGPRELATIPLHYDNRGAVGEGPEARSVDGRIVDIERGRSFDVAFGGSERFTASYVYRGGRFVGGSDDLRTWC